jgi:hypothetical protein
VKDKQTRIILKADRGVAHGRIVNIMGARSERAGAARDRHRRGQSAAQRSRER